MTKEPKRVVLGPDTDLRRVLEEVQRDKVPCLIERDGKIVGVVICAEEYFGTENASKTKDKLSAAENREDLWADYDPEKAREALRKSAGALAGVDREQLLADIRAARGQSSQGRPE